MSDRSAWASPLHFDKSLLPSGAMIAADREDVSVLIVDDDEDAHFFLARELSRAGIERPTSLHAGSEAIVHLNRCLQGMQPLPTLLFLDVMMPGTNGFQVLEWMQAQGLLARITVAMLTSSDNPADVARALARGAHVYLTKPVKADQLRPILGTAARLAAGVSSRAGS